MAEVLCSPLLRLPTELRLLLYEYLLVGSLPLTIEHWYGDVRVRDEIPKHVTDGLHLYRGIAILLSCRQCYTEGISTLLSRNHMVSLTPSEEQDPATSSTILVTVRVEKSYLNCIRAVSFSVNPLNWIAYDDLMDAMLLLSLICRASANLNYLAICSAHNQNEPSRWPRNRTWPSRTADILIPLAIRHYTRGLVRKLHCGQYESYIPVEVQQTSNQGEGHAQPPERDQDIPLWKPAESLQSIYCYKMKREEDEKWFATFFAHNALGQDRVVMVGDDLDEFTERHKFTKNLCSRDLFRLHESRFFPNCQMWDGLMVFLDDPKEASETGDFSYKVRFDQFSDEDERRDMDETDYLDQYGQVQEVELGREDYNDLRQVVDWFRLWWAANLPGQRRITDWLQ